MSPSPCTADARLSPAIPPSRRVLTGPGNIPGTVGYILLMLGSPPGPRSLPVRLRPGRWTSVARRLTFGSGRHRAIPAGLCCVPGPSVRAARSGLTQRTHVTEGPRWPRKCRPRHQRPGQIRRDGMRTGLPDCRLAASPTVRSWWELSHPGGKNPHQLANATGDDRFVSATRPSCMRR